MFSRGQDDTPTAHRTGPRRALAPLMGLAFAAALMAGCGGTGGETGGGETGEDPGTETSTAVETGGTTEEESSAAEEPTTTEPSDEGSGGGAGDGTTEPSDGGGFTSTEDGGDGGDTSAGGENLFEGTWGFGHDTKKLSAEELSTLLEEEAETRGPAEMTLTVECGKGVDTAAGDYDAECIAIADEGVEHLWLVTVGPADSGMGVEVENAG